jgi:hypothetical protein
MPRPEPYRPSPIPTSGLTLPSELDALLEQLAENVHDHWALGRMQQGWTYGRERSDEARTHPDLVPYAALPDQEKAFDQKTASETLLAILALGYRIIPPSHPGPPI